MSKVSVALCIPTYERSECVADFLENYAPHYIEAGIDIYYYDGSGSTKTEEVVCNYPKKEHVYYIKRPVDFHPLMIFQGYGLRKEYDFIWLCNDGFQYAKDAIKIIMTNLCADYDIVEINQSSLGIGTRIFYSYSEYMQKCAPYAGAWGAVLLNSHTMLNNVNWNNYEDLFAMDLLEEFWHLSFYFNRILELDRFCALYLAMDPQIIRSSKYKKSSGWIHNSLKVGFENFVNAIEGLPDCYEGKDIAIKNGLNFGLSTLTAMYYHRMAGTYSLKEYLKYKHIIAKFSTIPNYKMFALALAPRVCIRRFVEHKIGRSQEIRHLQRFYNSFSQIVIFGIGHGAFRLKEYFEQNSTEFKGFCAQRSHGKKEYMNYPIFSIDDVAHMEQVGVIVALPKHSAQAAIADITKKLSANSVYFSVNLDLVISYELGYPTVDWGAKSK